MADPVGPIRNGQKKPFRKCSQAVKEERTEQLAKYIGENPLSTKGELKEYAKTNFGIQYWMAQVYITRAKALLMKRSRMTTEQMKEIGVNVLLPLLNHPDARVRILAERRLAEIGGYDAPRRAEITGAGGGAIKTEGKVSLEHIPTERLLQLAQGDNLNGGNGR